MSRFAAFLDTCVLVPIAGADLLLRLAEAGLFRPLWSVRILQELEAALLEIHPDLASGGAERRISQMSSAFIDAEVSGWEPLAPHLRLPDPGDNHVLAAAIAGRADLIVTNNLRDFPADALATYGLEAQSLDNFLLNQLDLERETTLQALKAQSDATTRPPLTPERMLRHLASAGAPRFAEAAKTQLWRTQTTVRLGPV